MGKILNWRIYRNNVKSLTVSVSYNNNHYTTGTSSNMVYTCFGYPGPFQETDKTQEVPMVQRLSSLEMDTAPRVQTLDETDCISLSTNTLGKGINPIILPPAMGK